MSAKAISYVLLLVGSPDRQLHGARWIAIAAAHPPASAPLSVSAEELIKREVDALKAAAPFVDPSDAKAFQPAGEPSEISIGGKRMARLDITAQATVQGQNYDMADAQLAIIERGYLVIFIFSDPEGHESDRESAQKAMDSLHFFGKTN